MKRKGAKPDKKGNISFEELLEKHLGVPIEEILSSRGPEDPEAARRYAEEQRVRERLRLAEDARRLEHEARALAEAHENLGRAFEAGRAALGDINDRRPVPVDPQGRAIVCQARRGERLYVVTYVHGRAMGPGPWRSSTNFTVWSTRVNAGGPMEWRSVPYRRSGGGGDGEAVNTLRAILEDIFR